MTIARPMVVLFAVAVFPFPPLSAQVDSDVRLALEGQRRPPSWAEPDAPWLALEPVSAGYQLTPVTARFELTGPTCTGDSILAVTGPGSRPLVLMASPILTPGPVASFAVGRLFPGDTVRGRVPKGDVTLVATGTYHRTPPDPWFEDYRITATVGGVTQAVVHFPAGVVQEASPGVVWAGDLDRDGAVDFLVNLSTHYASRDYHLLLSTAASPGALFLDAGQLFVPGC
jgi:hypothetical protein